MSHRTDTSETGDGMENRGRRGFTLIELLIVVVIIGILASIAIPKFSEVRKKAFRSAMMSDLKNLATSQEIYHNSHYTYASTMTAAQSTASDGVTITINEANGTGWAATATHAALASQQCGVYHGSAAQANGSPATVVGVITCSF
jgi:prepilin-type N-terminal cleavage/methylation domain-containing protein